jgi:hypothetical protein
MSTAAKGVEQNGEEISCKKGCGACCRQLWTPMARLESNSWSREKVPWVPLILALEWADAHAHEPKPRPGHEVLREFFDCLTGKGVSQEKIDSAGGTNSA